MNNTNNQRVFRPVYGTESKILNHEITDGYLYIASDTGKIFLDAAEPDDPDQIPKRKQVGGSGSGGGGGSTGFYWGTGDEELGTIIKATDDVDDGDPVYYFSISAIEGNILPDNDGLILNSDGRFFRVTNNSLSGEGLFTVELIAVSGGGSGGGGGSSKNDLVASWDNIDALGATYIYGQDTEIIIYPHSENDDIISVRITAHDNTGEYPDVERSGRVYNDQPFKDFNASLLPPSNNITISVTIADSVYNKGHGRTYDFSPIRVLKMYLEKPAAAGMVTIQQGQAQIPYMPYFTGLGTTQNPVRAYYSVDDGEPQIGQVLISDNNQKQQRVNIPTQEHGMHVVKLWLNVSINNIEYDSDVITYEVPWVDVNNNTPIIWIESELGTVINYEEAVIKYMVYSSEAERQGAPVEVSVYHGTDLLNVEEVYYDSVSWHTLDLTANYTVGNNVFDLVCGLTSKQISFYVTNDGARDLSLRYEDQLEINFDATGRSSKEIKSSRSRWTSKVNPKKTNNGIPYEANFSGFNWQSNGWKNDDDGNGSYLSLANGASVTIPMSTISLNQSSAWTFEIRFRVRNAKRFATLVTNIPQYRYYTPEGSLSPLGEEKTIEEIAEIYNCTTNEATTHLLLDEDGNPVMNEANTVKKIVRANSDIAFKFLTNSATGFAIGTQEAYFSTPAGTVNVRYSENEIINIAFVFNKAENQLNIYLNGILSGSIGLSKITSITMENIPFVITSDDCDFDLYRFRVYPLALAMPDIIHNYIADIKNISIYDENDLADVNDDTKLSYQKLLQYNLDHPDNPTMPYAVIDLSDKTGQNAWLPFAKGEKRKAKITFVNPTADYLLATEQITPYQYYTHCPSFSSEDAEIDVQGTSSQKYPRRNFKTKFGKAKNWIYTQGELANTLIGDGGTLESGEKISKKWHMDSEKLGVNKFTWKIDYMESSGSYNTGFANFMGTGVYNKHPLEDLNIQGIDASIYRTSVYGFPMLVFYKGENQEYTYIGRYNLNLDKSANERYGFEEKFEQPYITKTREVTNEETGETTTETYHPTIAEIAECWELRDNQGTYCSWRYPNAAARSAGFDARLENDATRIAVSSHFEPRYNANADYIEYAQNIIAGNSTGDDDYSEQIGGNTPTIASAYVKRQMSNLEILFNWLDSTDITMANSSRPLASAITLRVNRQLEAADALEQGVTYTTQEESGVDITYGTFTTDSVEYRRQKFYAEFDKHLDREYCMVYFIMTELMLCYDSRGKNMMMATFGPRAQGGDYIWYPIFYDIDTQLGLNNVGAKLWDYDEDCTENGTFSTKSSVLWTNLYDVFKDAIIAKYGELRGSIVTYENIENSYLCRAGSTFNSYAMLGKRPILAIGLDAYYKYVLPTKEDWINQEGEPARADYLYACQGDRILSREMLINNRLLYMDSKYGSGNFTYERGGLSGINFRVSGNKPSTTSDKYIDAETLGLQVEDSWTNPSSGETLIAQNYPYRYFDAIPEYYVTPYLNFYPTMFVDKTRFKASEAYNPDKYPNGLPIKPTEDITGGYLSGDIDQQLNYIAGSKYVSSLGDLSTKYATEIHFPNAIRLRDITLGSDIPGYYNREQPNPLDLSAGVDLDGSIPDSNQKPLLEKIILTGMQGIVEGIDVQAATKLKEFRALNTRLPSVEFASGAPLTTVHLPQETTKLIFNENKDLTKIIRSTPVILDYDSSTNQVTNYRTPASYAGLYVAGLTDIVDDANNLGSGSNLEEISFSGDAMGYDSYEILRNVVHQKQGTGRSEGRLKVRMTDVAWSPYVQVEYGESKSNNETYYYLTDHSTYEPYTHAASEWLTDTLNGRVYTYDSNKDESIITDLSLLQVFINDMTATKAEEDAYNQTHPNNHITLINQFTNNIISMDSQATYPTLSGDMFISNASGTPVDEATLTSTYAAIWPNLRIRAANVDKAYISKFVQRLASGKDTEIDIHRASRNDDVHPVMTSIIPKRSNYVFQGWTEYPQYAIVDENQIASLINEHKILTSQEDFNELTFSNAKDTFIFYAVFSLTTYNYNFRKANGDLIKTYKVTYGSTMEQPLIWPAYDDSQLEADQTYKFLGWTENQEKCVLRNVREAEPYNFNTIAQTADKNLYPYFIAAGLKENIIPDAYCRIDQQPHIVEDSVTGYEIDLSRFDFIEGKITLPTVAADGYPYVAIGVNCFGGQILNDRNPSYVFWDGTPQIEYILSEAFMNKQSLIYFEWPDTVKYVNSFAFQECSSLHPITFNEGLLRIRDQAFFGAFDRNQRYDRLYIPSSMISLAGGDYQLYISCPVLSVEIGNETGSRLENIKPTTFGGSGSGVLANATSVIMHGMISSDEIAIKIMEACDAAGFSGTYEFL